MITLDSVSKSYDKGQPAINNISLHIDKGEFVFVVGNSGSGKSTLIKLLLKELDPTSGTISVNGKVLNRLPRRKISKYRRGVGVVFQDFRLLENKSVYENVAYAMEIIGRPERKIRKKVPLALEMVGLSHRANHYPNELSGGEQQRVVIARAIINNPSILICDEPTGNLDPVTSRDIMRILEEINKHGTTVVVVTHDSEMVNIMKKRVLTLENGYLTSDDVKGRYRNAK